MARPPRLGGFDYRGLHSYFLTFCTRGRRDALADASNAGMVLQQIRRTACRLDFAVLAYCVMPDHVHLLVQGRTIDADLKWFVKLAKQSSGQAFARRTGCPLWQAGYYDRVVRPEENLDGIARYILENPVRAGLVQSVADYVFAGSDVWDVTALFKRGSVPATETPGPPSAG